MHPNARLVGYYPTRTVRHCANGCFPKITQGSLALETFVIALHSSRLLGRDLVFFLPQDLLPSLVGLVLVNHLSSRDLL